MNQVSVVEFKNIFLFSDTNFTYNWFINNNTNEGTIYVANKTRFK